MNTLSTFLMILLLTLGFVALAPIFALGVGFLLFIGFGLLWFLPILLIACSNQTSGAEKTAWILAIVFLSWFAWIFYFLLAPIKPQSRHEQDSAYYY